MNIVKFGERKNGPAFGMAASVPAATSMAAPSRRQMIDPQTPIGATSACPTLTPLQAITTMSYDAVRSDAGAAPWPIDVWSKCRYVDNNTTDNTSYFIPFKSDTEWLAFIGDAPGSLSLVTCAKPTCPERGLHQPLPGFPGGKFAYARTGTVLTESATFTCAAPAAGCPDWTETVEADFTALNSDNADPSWSMGTPGYSGNPPDPATCAAAIDGACGIAHGTTTTSKPTSNLCSAGTASAVTGSGPWTWSCLGTNGGSNANCSAARTPCTAYCSLLPLCGPAQGVPSATFPASGRCGTRTAADGTVIGFISSMLNTTTWGISTWDWTCYSECCGTSVSCSAPLP
jgi:hypothetical protein